MPLDAYVAADFLGKKKEKMDGESQTNCSRNQFGLSLVGGMSEK